MGVHCYYWVSCQDFIRTPESVLALKIKTFDYTFSYLLRVGREGREELEVVKSVCQLYTCKSLTLLSL